MLLACKWSPNNEIFLPSSCTILQCPFACFFFQHVTRKMISVRWPKTFLILLTLMLAYQQLLQATLYLECHSPR